MYKDLYDLGEQVLLDKVLLRYQLQIVLFQLWSFWLFRNDLYFYKNTKIMTTLVKGDKAPEFIGIDQNGNTVRLSDFKGQKVVLFFYPKASTPGCTTEACNLEDNIERFNKENYQVIGVSADSQKRQLNFATKNNLSYPLLADEDRNIIEAYGVWGPKKFMGREYDGIHRTTFIIDENGLIEEVISKVKTKEHAAQILD